MQNFGFSQGGFQNGANMGQMMSDPSQTGFAQQQMPGQGIPPMFGQQMYGGNVPSYGQQWAEYESQAAQYSADLAAAQAAQQAQAAPDAAAAASGNDAAAAQQPQVQDTTQNTAVPNADINTGDGEMSEVAGYGGEYGYYSAIPVFGAEAGYMPEFGGEDYYLYEEVPAQQNAVQQQTPAVDGDQPVVNQKWRAHPVLVFSTMLVFFPLGLVLMLFFTDWGTFPKIYITIFVLAMALAVYEILVYKQALIAPSIIEWISSML